MELPPRPTFDDEYMAATLGELYAVKRAQDDYIVRLEQLIRGFDAADDALQRNGTNSTTIPVEEQA
jgi:hypothetical protein